MITNQMSERVKNTEYENSVGTPVQVLLITNDNFLQEMGNEFISMFLGSIN